MHGGPGADDPGQITISNRTLRTLIIEAYVIRNFQIEHPEWVEEKRFDIVAKVPHGATVQQARVMMRNLLVERFQLQIRREKRNLPVYDESQRRGSRDARHFDYLRKQSPAKMVTWLTGMLDRPVINQTGMRGDFDFTLTWSPEAGSDREGGSLVAAVRQQLGLRMEPRKTPVDMLIVVSARQVPTENQRPKII